MGALVLAVTFSLLGANPAVAQLKSVQGILSGVVRDTSGTPQLGASVQVIPESGLSATAIGFLTNTQGVFRGEKLAPGFYTVRVTLAGFLPTLEKHVRVSANLTTPRPYSAGIHVCLPRTIAPRSFCRGQRIG